MRRRRDRKADRRGLIIFAVTGALALLMISVSFLARDGGKYDAKTLCPQDRPFDRTVVIVDKTDRLSPAQGLFLKAEVLRLRDGMKTFDKLSIYILNEANMAVPVPAFELCNPGSGADANELYQNPKKLKRRFDERFGRPLEAVIETLLIGEKASSSPVMEMIKNVAFAEKFNDDKPGKRLILISDMLQHTAVFSHYRDPPDFLKFSQSDQYRRVQVPLPGVDIQIIYFFRDGQARRQSSKHIVFWEQYFQSMGASVSEVRYGP